MQRDVYRNLSELSRHIHAKWYLEDWENSLGQADIRLIRDLAAISLILGCYIVIFAR